MFKQFPSLDYLCFNHVSRSQAEDRNKIVTIFAGNEEKKYFEILNENSKN